MTETATQVDLWSVAATLFAAASLIAVVWQILRFEATQVMQAWEVSYGPSDEVAEGRREVRISFRPVGPVVVHEVEAHSWDAARVPVVSERARMDCDSEPLRASVVWLDGESAYAGFSWIRPAILRTVPVRQALRVRLSDGRWYLWRWHAFPRPARWRQGKWVRWRPDQPRRTFVPDLWGEPGSK